MSDFELIPTPSPSEFAIRIRVDNNVIPEGLQLSENQTLELYTPYREFRWAKVFERVKEFGDYVYTYAAAADEKHTFFHFGRPRTKAERDTPFDEFWTTRRYPWPAVLEDLYFVKTDAFPQATNTGAGAATTTRYFKRDVYRPSVSVDSRIRVQQYLSERPWSANDTRHPQPVPTEISTSFVGLSVSYPKCLHPRIEFPETVPSAELVDNAGVVTPDRVRAPTKQIFPATNFTDWRPFVLSDVVEPTQGMWLREKVTIFPPTRGEEIITST